MPVIAVGGFQHETNTFASVPATLADFEAPNAWPGLVRGGELFDAVPGIREDENGGVLATGTYDGMVLSIAVAPVMGADDEGSGLLRDQAVATLPAPVDLCALRQALLRALK